MLQGFHQLELVRQPESRGQGHQGAALVQGGQWHWHVEEKGSDAKADLKKHVESFIEHNGRLLVGLKDSSTDYSTIKS